MPCESDYSIKAAEWKLLDTGNPAFRPVGFADFGKNMQASFKIAPQESAERYWDRVRSTLAQARTR